MNKEITIIKEKVNKALQISEEIIVQDENSLSGAIDFLKKIKLTDKIIKKQKEKITKPLNEALKNARNMFRPVEDNYLQAEKNVKQKILDYNLVEEKKREEQEKKLADRVDKGTMKMETAVKKIEEMPKISNEGKIGKISTRINERVVIADETKIPRKYLMPNERLIKKDALNGIKIEGVKIIEEKILVSY